MIQRPDRGKALGGTENATEGNARHKASRSGDRNRCRHQSARTIMHQCPDVVCAGRGRSVEIDAPHIGPDRIAVVRSPGCDGRGRPGPGRVAGEHLEVIRCVSAQVCDGRTGQRGRGRSDGCPDPRTMRTDLHPIVRRQTARRRRRP